MSLLKTKQIEKANSFNSMTSYYNRFWNMKCIYKYFRLNSFMLLILQINILALSVKIKIKIK